MPNLRLTGGRARHRRVPLDAQGARPPSTARRCRRRTRRSSTRIALYFQMSTKTLFDAKAELAKMDLHGRERSTPARTSSRTTAATRATRSRASRTPSRSAPSSRRRARRPSTASTSGSCTSRTRARTGSAPSSTSRASSTATAPAGGRKSCGCRTSGSRQRELDQAVTAVLGFQQLNAAPSVVKELNAAPRPRSSAGGGSLRTTTARAATSSRASAGSFRSLVADPSLAPPIIQGEGAKVQSDWLFGFLQAPKTGEIRPWLEVHMPTFGFTDAELNDLTRYFASLDRAQYPFLVPATAEPGELGRGKKLFELLKCAQCHPRSIEDMNRPGVDRASLARTSRWPRRGCATTGSRTGSAGPTSGCRARGCPRTSPRGTTATGPRRSRPAASTRPSFAKDRDEYARIFGSDDRRRRIPVEPGGRDAGAARLRLVDRRERRDRARRDAAGSGAVGVRVRRAVVCESSHGRRLARRRAVERRDVETSGRSRPWGASPSTSPFSTAAWGSRSRRSCCFCG